MDTVNVVARRIITAVLLAMSYGVLLFAGIINSIPHIALIIAVAIFILINWDGLYSLYRDGSRFMLWTTAVTLVSLVIGVLLPNLYVYSLFVLVAYVVAYNQLYTFNGNESWKSIGFSAVIVYLGVGFSLGFVMEKTVSAMNWKGVAYYAATWPLMIASGVSGKNLIPIPNWAFSFPAE